MFRQPRANAKRRFARANGLRHGDAGYFDDMFDARCRASPPPMPLMSLQPIWPEQKEGAKTREGGAADDVVPSARCSAAGVQMRPDGSANAPQRSFRGGIPHHENRSQTPCAVR